MNTVQDIEQAIRELSLQQLSEFRAGFAEFDAAAWDAQFEADASSGRLDRAADEAIREFRSGHCRRLI